MAVESVLIINNYGKPRLATFYHSIPPAQQQLLIRTIFKLVSSRPDGDVCNFLDAPELDPLLQTGRPGDATKSKSKPRGEKGEGSSTISSGQERRVIYRHYATLWFVFVVDQSESELGILDLIQVFVESLDRFFPNVCELDLIFHYEEVNAILAEVIQGGLVLETNISEIVKQGGCIERLEKGVIRNLVLTMISDLHRNLAQ
ncbi:Adaptor protein complex sigma subunit [Microstroma glucosiphilum]|uniref:AP complex subunit sigma n=1 Tax=Pseudomicrostroma glucosiphilum TaxID=1684307 RepID=A0A316UCP4_9BASI|nr:Adaptor protein complex sigma subunit [Pseudomicrostroma glucosiphilum]PWN22959.1 Adaptor protein complex sigma subunit [Pseudomicrostroma glucosiphilum]